MIMTDNEIRQAIADGAIHISPFDESFLNNASYDLTLGENVARYKKFGSGSLVELEKNTDLFRLEVSAKGHVLQPGERVLGHTREFIGGRVSSDKSYAVNASMHSTSTAQRLGISVCLDAGWGDIGYVNRWTLEITNHTPVALLLPVGAVICQIVFHKTNVPQKTYDQMGHYRATDDNQTWTPQEMLPKKLKVRL
jgi:dCTP deaminase